MTKRCDPYLTNEATVKRVRTGDAFEGPTIRFLVMGEVKFYTNIHKNLLYNLCDFEEVINTGFAFKRNGTFRFESHAAVDVFKMFNSWLYTGSIFNTNADRSLSEGQYLDLIELWIFGDRIGVPDLQDAALQGMDLWRFSHNDFVFKSLEYVVQHTEEDSRLRTYMVDRCIWIVNHTKIDLDPFARLDDATECLLLGFQELANIPKNLGGRSVFDKEPVFRLDRYLMSSSNIGTPLAFGYGAYNKTITEMSQHEVAVLFLLRDKPIAAADMCVQDIVNRIGIEESIVTEALSVLQAEGYVVEDAKSEKVTQALRVLQAEGYVIEDAESEKEARRWKYFLS